MQKTAKWPGMFMAVSTDRSYCRRTLLKTLLVLQRLRDAEYAGCVNRQLLRTMKLTVLLLMVAFLHVQATGSAQTITFSGKDVPLKKVFNSIRKQTGYFVFWDADLLNSARSISLAVREMPLRQFLDTLLRNQPFTYKIADRTISLIWKPDNGSPEKPPAATKADQQLMITVIGVLQDANKKEPLAGATIMIKGTKTMVVSDGNGRFSIGANLGDVLVISYVGFEKMEIKVTSANMGIISLRPVVTAMQDMVYTGIFARPKENFTGASSSFTQEELKKVSSVNTLSALASLDPSFHIIENISVGSNPNVLPNVVLRGGNSLEDISQGTKSNIFNYNNSPNVPLFILDGFETTLQRINDLDINRIAKVDILKDAAATSIYGSRAANGVVVIETVRPQPGKLRVSYNANLVVETPDLSGYHLLNAREKLNLETAAGIYNSTGPNNSAAQDLQYYYNSRLRAINSGVNTDWMALPLRTSVAHRHNLYVEGGTNDILYGIGGSYNKALGVMKGSDRTTISANSYLSYRVSKFNFRNDFSITFNTADNSPYGNFTQYVRLNPYLTPYDSLGQMKYYLEDVRDNQGNVLQSTPFIRKLNPLYNATLHQVDQTTYMNVVNNLSAEWRPKNWLRISSRLAASRQTDEGDNFLPARHTSFATTPIFQKGSFTKSNGKNSSIEGSLSADVNKQFGKSLIFATVNGNVISRQFSTQSIQVIGFPNERLDDFSLGAGYATGAKPSGTESITHMSGFLSNLSYSYDNRYLLDLSYRLDGSSQFGSNRRGAPFWSAGIGWNLHKEALFKHLNYINRLKLRYSYGSTGSQNFASFQGITTSTYFNNSEYRGQIGTYLMGYGNPNLIWQKTNKNNLGLDLSLFKRLDITANYFIETTTGSIASISTPPSVGVGSYMENIGDLISKGLEVNARVNLLTSAKGRNNWSVFVNAFSVHNKIRKISSTISQINKRNMGVGGSTPLPLYQEGQSTSVIWTVPSLGIDPATGLEIFRTRNGGLTNIYNPQDKVVTGDTRSDVEGTLGTNLEINGFGLNLFLRYRLGGQAFNQTLIDRVENVDIPNDNVDRRVLEQRWMKPGDHTFFKGINNPDNLNMGMTQASSRFVQNDNLLSGESISVYYRFSDAFNKRLGVQNTRISIYTQNMFRISSIKRERGIDYPYSETYTLQLQTSF